MAKGLNRYTICKKILAEFKAENSNLDLDKWLEDKIAGQNNRPIIIKVKENK